MLTATASTGESPGNAARPRRDTEGAESGSATNTTAPSVPPAGDITPSSVPVFELPLSEEQVVGAALLGHLDGLDLLEPTDLVDPRRAAITQAIKALHANGAPTDPAAVVAWLLASPEVRWTAGKNIGVRVAELVEAVAVPASSSYHARLVLEAAARRRAVVLADQVLDVAATVPIEDIVGRIELLVVELIAAVDRVTR